MQNSRRKPVILEALVPFKQQFRFRILFGTDCRLYILEQVNIVTAADGKWFGHVIINAECSISKVVTMTKFW